MSYSDRVLPTHTRHASSGAATSSCVRVRELDSCAPIPRPPARKQIRKWTPFPECGCHCRQSPPVTTVVGETHRMPVRSTGARARAATSKYGCQSAPGGRHKFRVGHENKLCSMINYSAFWLRLSGGRHTIVTEIRSKIEIQRYFEAPQPCSAHQWTRCGYCTSGCSSGSPQSPSFSAG